MKEITTSSVPQSYKYKQVTIKLMKEENGVTNLNEPYNYSRSTTPQSATISKKREKKKKRFIPFGLYFFHSQQRIKSRTIGTKQTSSRRYLSPDN